MRLVLETERHERRSMLGIEISSADTRRAGCADMNEVSKPFKKLVLDRSSYRRPYLEQCETAEPFKAFSER